MANAQLEGQISQAKAAGFNDNDIKSFLTQKGFNLSGTRYQGGVGGFINRNLSTIGSVALPAIADVATGGLAIPADAALSAAGSGLGKVATNATEGEKLGSGVGGATAAGAVGGLIGGAAGKVLGGAGKAISGTINKTTTDKVTQDSAQKALDTIKPFIGTKEAVDPANDLKGTIGMMKDLNMPATPEAMHTAAKLTTGAADTSGKAGSDAAYNTVLRGIIGSGGKEEGKPIQVGVGDYLNTVKNAINKEPKLGMAEAKTGSGAKLMSTITKNKQENLLGGIGSTTEKADGRDVLDSIQFHDREANKYDKAFGKSGNTEDQAIANVHHAASDYLNKQLGDDAGANKAVSDFTLHPDDAQAIKDHVSASGGSDELGQHIVDTINNADSVKALRSAQAPFVHAGKLADAADDLAKSRGFINDTEAAAGEEPDASNINDASQLVSHAATHNHIGFANTIGNLIRKGVTSDTVLTPASKIASAAGKVNNILPGKGTTTDLLSNLAGQTVARSGTEQQQSGSAPSVTGITTDQTGDTTGESPVPNVPQFTQSDLAAAVSADPTHASVYEALYTAMQKPQTDNLTTNQQNELTGSQNAIAAAKDYLSQIQDVQNNGGVDTGPVGGSIGALLGKYNIGGQTTANTYALKTSTADVAAQIAGGLSPTGKPSQTLLRSVENSLPKVTDSPAAAQAKVAYLVGRLERVQQTEAQPLSDIVDGLSNG